MCNSFNLISMLEPDQVPNLLSDLGYDENFGTARVGPLGFSATGTENLNRSATEDQTGAGDVQEDVPDLDTEPSTQGESVARQEQSPRASSASLPVSARRVEAAMSPPMKPGPAASKTRLQVSQPPQEQSPGASSSFEAENNDNDVQFDEDRSPMHRIDRVKLTRHRGFKKVVVDSCLKKSNGKLKTKNPKALKMIENEMSKAKKTPNTNMSCRFCFEKFNTKSKLHKHYSRKHLQKQLKKYVDEKSKECKICRKEMGKIAHLIDHVGAVHGVIDKLLDNDNDDSRAAATLENLIEVDGNSQENEVKIENDDDEVVILEQFSKKKPVPDMNNELINDLSLSEDSD